jgi:DNA repair protein RecO (recombination protein O)
MVNLSTPAIICALRAHGEHGVIVRVLTQSHGLVAGYVNGGRAKTLRPILIPGNHVACQLRSRVPGQMPQLTVELIESRGPLMSEPLAASGVEWVTVLTATCLPEEHPYPGLYEALDAVLSAIAHAPSARGWAQTLIRYEALLLSVQGFGGGAVATDESWAAVFQSLSASRKRLVTQLLDGRRDHILDARDRLIARFERAVA